MAWKRKKDLCLVYCYLLLLGSSGAQSNRIWFVYPVWTRIEGNLHHLLQQGPHASQVPSNGWREESSGDQKKIYFSPTLSSKRPLTKGKLVLKNGAQFPSKCFGSQATNSWRHPSNAGRDGWIIWMGTLTRKKCRRKRIWFFSTSSRGNGVNGHRSSPSSIIGGPSIKSKIDFIPWFADTKRTRIVPQLSASWWRRLSPRPRFMRVKKRRPSELRRKTELIFWEFSAPSRNISRTTIADVISFIVQSECDFEPFHRPLQLALLLHVGLPFHGFVQVHDISEALPGELFRHNFL